MSDKKDFFDGMSGKTVFVFGLVAGVAVMSLFGNGISLPKSAAQEKTPKVVVQPTEQPSADAGDDAAANVPVVTDEDYIRGDIDAPITWIVYSDYECPFCQRFHSTTTQMLEEYAGKVKVVFRHFPLSFHEPAATNAAIGAECAGAQGGDEAFWEFSDLYFERTATNGQGLRTGTLTDIAKEIGLNTKKFDTCIVSGDYNDEVQADIAGGSGAGVTGTPGSIVIDAEGNAFSVPGAIPFDQVASILDEMTAGL